MASNEPDVDASDPDAAHVQPDPEYDGDDSPDEWDDSSSVSSWSQSDEPEAFAPMPPALTLPVELQRLILHLSDRYEDLWGTYRLVCKDWKLEVERMAKMVWIRETSFYFPGALIYDTEKEREVRLDADFTFTHLDGDMAIFKITKDNCKTKYLDTRVVACTRGVPDVQVDELVHDVPIPGLSIDWPTLTLTAPWRPTIARVLAEELRVTAHRATPYKKLMTLAKRAQSASVEKMTEYMYLYAEMYLDAYVAVRTKRRGKRDGRGDERLKMTRFVASWKGDEDEKEDKNENKNKKDEQSGEMSQGDE
ncbi:hypothetical protein R3P38DRAFT_416576 [Favolaschia claudopus]|uniref:F-box domain-containing protein n=1 Tax=Favolaschia claudopus TaxID=2862362 RepID=A0AAV9ZHB5_9AGAR